MSIKIKAATKDLLKAFDRLSHIPGALNHPCAQLIKLCADMAGLSMVRVSPEFYARIIFEADVQSEGSVTVPYALLHGVLGRIDSAEVEIRAKDRMSIEVVGGSSKATIAIVREDNALPTPDEELADCAIQAEASDLREWLSSARRAASVEQGSKHALRGVIVRGIGEQVGINGTDGLRVHHIKTGLRGKVDFTIPNEGVNAILKMLDGARCALDVNFCKSNVSISGPDMDLICNRLAETAPNFDGMLDLKVEQIHNRFGCEKKELCDALKACAAMTSGDTRQVDFECSPGLAKILSFQGGAFSFNRTIKISCDTEFKFAVNANYLLDALEVVTGGEVAIFDTERAVYLMDGDRIALVAKMTYGKTREQEEKKK